MSSLPWSFPRQTSSTTSSACEPAEILVDTDGRTLLDDITANDTNRKSALSKTVIRSLDESILDPELAADSLKKHFSTDNLEPFELDGQPLATIAAASAIDFLAQTQIGRLPFITTLRRHRPDRYMYIPAAALRDLEILTPTIDGGPTLLSTLDTTRTPMGARLLRDWLSGPLTDLDGLNTRQLAVNTLFHGATLRSSLDQTLSNTPDLARLVNRLTLGQSEPRELRALFRGLDKAPALRELTINQSEAKSISPLFEGVASHDEVRELIDRAIVEDPPFRVSDGGMIKPDFDHDLDKLRSTASRARAGIAAIESKARESSGIPNLKVGHNRVFGYYIEVSRSHLGKVPPEFLRRQTLVNAERFITPSLKTLKIKFSAPATRSANSNSPSTAACASKSPNTPLPLCEPLRPSPTSTSASPSPASPPKTTGPCHSSTPEIPSKSKMGATR